MALTLTILCHGYNYCMLKQLNNTCYSFLQGSSVDILVANKVDLIEWLSTDLLYILQHAQADRIIDHRVYRKLKVLQPEAACIELIDTVIDRGEGTSSEFLKLLGKPKILNTYPQLKEWNASLALQGACVRERGYYYFTGRPGLVSTSVTA